MSFVVIVMSMAIPGFRMTVPRMVILPSRGTRAKPAAPSAVMLIENLYELRLSSLATAPLMPIPPVPSVPGASLAVPGVAAGLVPPGVAVAPLPPHAATRSAAARIEMVVQRLRVIGFTSWDRPAGRSDGWPRPRIGACRSTTGHRIR